MNAQPATAESTEQSGDTRTDNIDVESLVDVDSLVDEELLVEDVSIDGMCGVY